MCTPATVGLRLCLILLFSVYFFCNSSLWFCTRFRYCGPSRIVDSIVLFFYWGPGLNVYIYITHVHSHFITSIYSNRQSAITLHFIVLRSVRITIQLVRRVKVKFEKSVSENHAPEKKEKKKIGVIWLLQLQFEDNVFICCTTCSLYILLTHITNSARMLTGLLFVAVRQKHEHCDLFCQLDISCIYLQTLHKHQTFDFKTISSQPILRLLSLIMLIWSCFTLIVLADICDYR